MSQELLVFGIVGFTFLAVGFRVFRVHLAAPFSTWLLRHGYVKAGMWLRHRAVLKSACSNCKC